MKIISLIILLCLSLDTQAEMYIWYDEYGVKHVSTVPRDCVKKNDRGSSYLDYNCNPSQSVESRQRQLITEAVEEMQSESIIIRGGVLSVAADGLLLTDVSRTKEGGKDQRFYSIEGNVFVKISDAIRYTDDSKYEGHAKLIGRYQYESVLGAASTVPMYESLEKQITEILSQ